MAESSSVQSLDRAFDLLELLCKSRNGMTIGPRITLIANEISTGNTT